MNLLRLVWTSLKVETCLNFSVESRVLRLDECRRQNALLIVALDVDFEELLNVANEGDVDVARLAGVAVTHEDVEYICALQQVNGSQ